MARRPQRDRRSARRARPPLRQGLRLPLRTSLEFTLDGRFSRFEAEVGVSDEVQALPDHGAIEFRVLVDGQERWKSPVLHGGDAPVSVGPIPLTGAKSITLVTDFGEGEDVADRGVWGFPLLYR